MHKKDQKRFYRELKRAVKKAGNHQRRNFFKRSLRDNPNETHWDEFEFGGRNDSSQWLNGIDKEGQHGKAHLDCDKGVFPMGEGGEATGP